MNERVVSIQRSDYLYIYIQQKRPKKPSKRETLYLNSMKRLLFEEQKIKCYKVQKSQKGATRTR